MRFSIERYNTLDKLKRELSNGLKKLTFSDNFQSTTKIVTIPVGNEIEVTHDLQLTPNNYIIGKETANGKIIAGPTDFNSQAIYLQNLGPDTNTVTITIFI